MRYRDIIKEDAAPATYWTPEQIKHWTSYTSGLKFKNETEAREWLFRKLERTDQEPSSVLFGKNGPEKNRTIADTAPVFKIGNSFKIGKRTAKRRVAWEGIEIKRPSLAPLESAGWLNPFDGYRVLGIQKVPVADLHMTEQHSFTESGINNVYRIAASIKEDEWFRAIIVTDEGTILDGHHRFRAVRDVLKWKVIPALVVHIGNDDEDDLTESEGTAGATCASSIATVAHPVGGIGPGFGGTDKGIYNGAKKKKPLMLRR